METMQRLRSLAAGAVLVALVLVTAVPASLADEPKVASFALGNGMQVVVIEDHRAPVVTHMVWYRVGAADDPPGKSGLAHFLEHLMFKQTSRLASGEYIRILTRIGGRHNALTSHDTTSYFQRTAKQHLRRLMELEADRMVGLKLAEDEVLTERAVIEEERRSSVDASPISTLNEEVLAALFLNHPYGRPVLGWAHEMAALTREDALAFYRRHYAPNNSVLVVAGDVTPEEVRGLAEETYGRLEANATVAPRLRPQEPRPVAARKVRLEDARAGAPLILRYHLTPSYRTAKAGDAEALNVLARILGGDDTSRLYRDLVLERRIAVQAGADFRGDGLDSGRLTLLALAGQDATEGQLEQAIDEVVAGVLEKGVTEEELVRAKRALEAARVFDADSQEKLARRYGEAVTVGRPVEDVAESARRTEAVTPEDVRRVAAEFLDIRRSVTGALVRPRTAAAGGVALDKK